MLEKILLFLFPKTINKIVKDSMKEAENAEIIAEYGSMENYYQAMNKYAEDAELAEKLERQRIEDEMRGLDEFLEYISERQSYDDY